MINVLIRVDGKAKSGKTTIANKIAELLKLEGYVVRLSDNDGEKTILSISK